MKLYATVTDTRGKKDGRGDNEYLEVLLNERNNNRFLIAFDGSAIFVLNYSTGQRTRIDYMKGEKEKGELQGCCVSGCVSDARLNHTTCSVHKDLD
jgi:hypothetical protein